MCFVADLSGPGVREALASLAGALRPLGVDYMVLGGIAVIAHGVPRQTVDLDATVWAEGLDIDRLLEGLGSAGILPRVDDAAEFARRHQVLLLVHGPSSTPLDLSLAWLPFEREAIDAAEPLNLAGIDVPVVRVEDLLIYKAVAWRDRDRSDIERLLALHSGAVDVGRVRRVLAEFAEALEEPDRLAAFDELVARALKG
jgi:hypothetical protein